MSRRIVVFGSFVTDLTSVSDGFPVPGQTIMGKSFKSGPGGKGSNQAVAAHRAGGSVHFITKLGDDTFGREAMAFYRKEGMDTCGVIVDGAQSTGIAMIMVDAATKQNEIIVVSGACATFGEADMERPLAELTGEDILLTQLETNYDATFAMLKQGRARGALTVLNPAPAGEIPPEVLACVDIITPNETEAEAITGVAVHTLADAEKAARLLCQKGVGKVIITWGDKGAYAFDGREGRLIPAVNCGACVDTTGAGDSFSGGLVAALAEGKDFFAAAEFAAVVGGLAVTAFGTAPAMPYREEINKWMK